MQIAQSVRYIHQTNPVHDGQDILSLFTEKDVLSLYTEKNVYLGEAPVVLNNRRDTKRAIQVIIEDLFEDGHQGVRYTSTDLNNSSKPIKGSYFSQKAIEHIKEAPGKWATHKVRKVKRSKLAKILGLGSS